MRCEAASSMRFNKAALDVPPAMHMASVVSMLLVL